MGTLSPRTEIAAPLEVVVLNTEDDDNDGVDDAGTAIGAVAGAGAENDDERATRAGIDNREAEVPEAVEEAAAASADDERRAPPASNAGTPVDKRAVRGSAVFGIGVGAISVPDAVRGRAANR